MNNIQNLFLGFPDDSRVLIFAGDRPLSSEISNRIDDALGPFLISWTAHGKNLRAVHQILSDRFVVIAINDQVESPSGCSIDSLSRRIKEIGESTGIDFFNNGQVFYIEKDNVNAVPINELKVAISSGTIKEETLIYTPVNTLGELYHGWQKQAGKSWLKRYFKLTLSLK